MKGVFLLRKCLLFILFLSLSLFCSGCFEDDGTQAYIEELEEMHNIECQEWEARYEELSKYYNYLEADYFDLKDDYQSLCESLDNNYISQDYYNDLFEDYAEAANLCEILQQELSLYEDEIIELKKEIAELKNKSN